MSKAQEILSQLRNIDSELASYAYIDGDEADFQVRRLQREKKRLESMLAAPPAQDSDHEFKNFHRLLCDRFGYTHDDVDWKRDQISLIEWIAKQVKPAQPAVQGPVRIYDYVWPQRDEHKDDCVYACSYTPGHHLARGELLAVVHPSQLKNAYLQRDDEDTPLNVASLPAAQPAPVPDLTHDQTDY